MADSSRPTLRLYNTLNRTVTPIEPAEPNHLRMYSCGPTVYSYAHIGNFRSFLTADLILRTAQALGWQTTYVSNITDVGHLTEDDQADAQGQDRMAKALESKEGERFANVWDLARYYANTLLDDWQALNLLEPDVRPRATEHVREQIRAVAALLASGHAYETPTGVYFSVAQFADYGKLSGNRTADQLAEHVRDVVVDPNKRDQRDFALWKKDDKHLMQWYSPWGWGFPGWHIECSVMAQGYLGDTIDLHAGGEDLIFPHHECEIAQSESLTGKPFATYWVHTRFLQVEGEKMAKRTGNFFTVRDLIAPEDEGGRGFDPMALRLTLISGQYRKPFNFTFQQLRASAKHVQRIQETVQLVAEAVAENREGPARFGERLTQIYDAILAALCDDLNTPEAIAQTLKGLRLISGMAPLNGASAQQAQHWFDQTNALLGIMAPTPTQSTPETDPLVAQVEGLLVERATARQNRDFARADGIRDELDALGIEVMDTPDGAKWRKKV